ncbi:MAG: nitroreductase [Pseudomonadota bacterium]
MNDPRGVDTILAYHQRTKHRLERYAAGPDSLDWDAQPAAFRRWSGTRWYSLPRTAPELDIPWSALADARPAAPFDLDNLSRLLRLTMAITAWKQYGEARWALRAHPSSGNLHPTETWVVAYWVDGLADGLYHYQNADHTVEWRASTLTAAETPGLWLGFTSIPWREAWKYGERAFRYCQLDMGHVLGAVAHAAALFGWQARLVPLDHATLARCLGTDRAEDFAGVEAEEAEVMVAIHAPGPGEVPEPPLDWDEWSGLPALLDPRPMYQWPVIDEVMAATRGALPPYPASGRGLGRGTWVGEIGDYSSPPALYAPMGAPPLAGEGSDPPATRVILQRRSAQAFDGQSVMPGPVFRRILTSLLPDMATPGSPVWRLWNRTPRVHPVLLVHRVDGLAPGLYILPRSEAGLTGLGAAMRQAFHWTSADPVLPLYQLVAANAERTARTVSCHQDIASCSAFTLMFVAEFDGPLADNPAAYRHLHWEAGMLGHCATLAAEAAGWRGTGIGCFFDDTDHEVLGLADSRYQVLYHYAVGMPLVDARIATLPAYG